MTLSSALKDAGNASTYVGCASLFVMAAAGLLAIDVVMFVASQAQDNKHEKDKKHRHVQYDINNSFICQLILHCISGSSDIFSTLSTLLIVSPITSAVAVALSVTYGVPLVGMIIAGGWLLAISCVALGYALQNIAEYVADKDSNNIVTPNISETVPVPVAEACYYEATPIAAPVSKEYLPSAPPIASMIH